MASLTKSRLTPGREGVRFEDPTAASVKIYDGALVALDATGNATPAARVNVTHKIRGVAVETVDNGSGAAGVLKVRTKTGVFRFDNASGANAVGRGDIGKQVTAEDDHTASSRTGTYLKAGTCVDVDDAGVWVRVG